MNVPILTVFDDAGNKVEIPAIKGDKGDTGAKGEAGLDAGITGATASVDNTVGVAEVSVDVGGTAQARTFDFKFLHLKGDKGDTGEKGEQGERGVQGETGINANVSAETVSLLAANWAGDVSPYSQTASMTTVSASSLVNTCPSTANLQAAIDEGYMITLAQDAGAVTFYALGNKPTTDIELQCAVYTVTEVTP